MQKYTDVGVPGFYKFLTREMYLKLVSTAAKLMAMFGTWQYVRLWTVFLINKDQQIRFAIETNKWTFACNIKISYHPWFQA